eukprot:14062764-Heterocapsa_arctica.AAC.1
MEEENKKCLPRSSSSTSSLVKKKLALHAEAVEAAKTKELGSFKVNDVYREVPASQADGFRKIQTLW